MSKAAKDAALKNFKEEPDCRVLLMSLQAGGVALNLTAASHVRSVQLIKQLLLEHVLFSDIRVFDCIGVYDGPVVEPSG